jgi:hypothetical protein
VEDHLAATRQQVPVPKLPVRRSIELAGKAAAVLTVRSRKAPKCPATLQFERKIRSSIRKSKAFARDVDRGSVVSERRHRSDNKRALAHSVCYAVEHSRGEMIVRIIWGMVLLTRLTVLPVSGAEVERQATAGGTVAISIAGEIVEGDAEALRLEIQRAQLANYPISEIQLNSIGGSLYEGTSLARVVRAASLNTRVAERNICASACFLVFAAGSTKSVQNGARVGVHAATTASGDNTQISIKATEAMGRIAKLLGVPSGIVERMVSTPSQMFWLNGANFVSMGAVITDGK